ncbi:MAG: DUF4915 domain-containing protein, partial [Planctomycetaceae bacterium]
MFVAKGFWDHDLTILQHQGATMSTTPTPRTTEARFSHTGNLPELLASLGASVLISTYQAGQLVAVGTHAGKLRFSINQFEQAMGVAVAPNRLAVGSKRQVWMLL